ncbi:poly(ethylene terephthalate) hydrolase family protein [Pseudoduganella umbonata]|uniref:Dienelactone hydrolase n=1 Tax=Pseudoduganella umbonata TaxID=864828 RepID=A0A4P8HZM4_9BURK|nr:CocE/NonD family hydrolase [Pseudoduganella umbonata]MBB3224112.1 dienelactone hydrolase [Pseudoduganella umbonata]QCP14024.1 dienelactone hydrolase [Pseudoduganella umbonata]
MRLFLLALTFCAATAAQAADTFAFPLQPGPHAVGLQVKQQYDRSRVYKTRVSLVTGKPASGERARPMQMLVWYPAARGGKPVTFRDYYATGATEADLTLDAAEVGRITDAQLAEQISGWPAGAEAVARPMWAVRDAPAKPGKFPVVIYAPSFSAGAAENADLCEYLASHGYIVLASVSQGAHQRSMTLDVEGVETQAADIAWLISQAGTMANADTDRLAVAGFSWGGLANVVAAARDDRIKALVSLDGSVRYFPDMVDGGKAAIPYVTPARVAVPMLYVAQRPATIEELNRNEKSTGFSLLNRMTYADVYVVTMHPMQHRHFSAQGLHLARDGEFDGDYTRDDVTAAYGWMARYVHRFLDGYLKDDAAARTFMANKPVANGVPRHMVSLDARPGSGVPPTLENFAAQLAARGFDNAAAIHDELKAQGATFKLEPHDINSWGYELLRGGMARESVAIFRFGTQLHPKDANLYDSLGEAQAKAGQREAAIDNYRRSLALNPKNANAVERLKALGAPAAP